MLSDLVAGAGCDVTGENNALAKLSGAIYGGLEREYARREGEGSSSSAFAGPSSDSLPPMSEEEAAFRARFTGGPSEPAASTVPSHPPSLAAVAPPSAIAPAIAPAATASLAAADPTEQAAVSEAVSGGYASGASGDVGFAEHRPPRWHPPHERSLPRGGFAPPPELVWLQEAREARARREREAVARRAARDGSEWPGGLRAEAQAQAQAQALPAASTARRGGEARGDARGEARGGRGAASAASSGTQYADEIASEMEGAWGVGAGDLDSAAAAWEGLADSGSGTGLQALWESLRGEVEGLDGLASPPWGEEGGAAGAAEEQQYAFREPNPFLGAGGGREGLVQAGSELLGQGDLPQAILALEAAVRSEPAREASDSTQLDEAGREEARRESVAWQLLGQAHADADDDAAAISCLRRAVAADAQNLAALLALGVSYTNELDASRALDHLRLWLRRHPDFASLAPAEEEVGKGKYDVWARQADTTALFLRAVGRAPHSADLHAVLGVLHNLSREYGAAVSSFERALELRPEDYSLWNKLGATQANAMSCAAAVPCYVRALELRPNYVRALTNLGISYGNLSEQRAAAQCYLKALSLNQDAAHVWTYLTMVFSAMGRTDYVQMAAATDLAALCAEFEV